VRFFKAQVSAFSSTVVDFSTALVGVELFNINYLPGSVAGNIAGGITNFYLGRNWVFGKGVKSTGHQAVRYLLIWLGSMLLNSSGVYLLVEYAGLNYILGKCIMSLLVSVTFNYFSHSYFVFK